MSETAPSSSPSRDAAPAIKTIAAPDPQPVKPGYRMPPGACDAHCHVFGPGAVFPYAAERRYTPPDAPYERLRALHDHLGIERAVIVQATPHGTDNTAALDAIARSEGRYRGVAIVARDVGEAELERLNAGGMRAARYNFLARLGGQSAVEAFDATIDKIRAIGWHVVIHAAPQDIVTFEEKLRGLDVPFILDHMGLCKADTLDHPGFAILRDLLKGGLCWAKLSGGERVSPSGKRPFHDAAPVARALIETAPERLLWGTDWPHPNVPGEMPNDGELVDLFAHFTEDEALRRQILVDNPTALYWAD